MFDRKSGHAINKKENDAIVYADAYGNITRLTAKDFSSEQEFRKWKDLLTEVNHLEEKEDHVFRNHTVSLSPFTESAAKIPSTEDRMIAAEERQAHIQHTMALMEKVRQIVSELQYRRLWMYYIDGYSTHEIALWEGTSHQAISKSIRAAQKNIFQISGKRVAKTPKNRR